MALLNENIIFAGRWKYLSHWIMCFNLAYSAYAVIVDIYCIVTSYTCQPKENEEDDERPKVVVIRDDLFNCIGFPLGFLHTVLFAVLTSINTGYFVSLINQKKETLSSYMMIYLHVFPLVMCVIESVLVYHKFTSCKKAIQKTLLASLVYLLWICWVAYFGSYWSYPFLRRAAAGVRALFLPLFPLLSTGCYFVGKKLTHYFWHSDMEKQKYEWRSYWNVSILNTYS